MGRSIEGVIGMASGQRHAPLRRRATITASSVARRWRPCHGGRRPGHHRRRCGDRSPQRSRPSGGATNMNRLAVPLPSYSWSCRAGCWGGLLLRRVPDGTPDSAPPVASPGRSCAPRHRKNRNADKQAMHADEHRCSVTGRDLISHPMAHARHRHGPSAFIGAHRLLIRDNNSLPPTVSGVGSEAASPFRQSKSERHREGPDPDRHGHSIFNATG